MSLTLRRLIPLFLTLIVSACSAPVGNSNTSAPAQRAASLPPMKQFTASTPSPAARSNAEIALDFLDLSFALENGMELPFFTRFEGPVRVAVRGEAPASLKGDLTALLNRLRREARIDIRLARSEASAQIFVDAVPIRRLQRVVPNAACFVVPNVKSFAEYKRSRGAPHTLWANLKTRETATVVIPSDMPPQEIRDCLHEEIGQALGPLNDLYRLPDSVFNDDNFHNVLTGFDMLILRAYYAPEMANGMTRARARQVLTTLLPNLNPRGGQVAGRVVSSTPKVWNDHIVNALAPSSSSAERMRRALQALSIARQRGWQDNRLALSLFVHGRVSLGRNATAAIDSLVGSGELYKKLYGSSVQVAYVATQMAAFALTAGEYSAAIRIADDALPAARKGENAAVMATLMLLKAQALEKQGRQKAAERLRVDAVGWARYGFGSDTRLRARIAEINALTPD